MVARGRAGLMLSLQGITLAYEEKPALAGLDLEVGDGEIVALLGPSGCGKTSLLRVVAGLTVADEGRVVLDGRDLGRVPTHQRGIGLMFQDYALFPHRDVAANVAFGLRMRGDAPAARQARVDEVLELVGLAGFGPRGVATLSGGERQRVALARALAPAPSLLMLDEPLGALDRTLRDRLVMELSELFAELAISVMYVTHDQAEALALADRVVVMNEGGVVQQGAPEQVWAAPADPFVARFLGLSNVFPAVVDDDGRADLGWVGLTLDESAPGPSPALGPAPDGGSAGRSVTVLIRPEAVVIVEPAPVGAVTAVVEAVAFRGDHTQIWLALGSGERIEVRRSAPGRPAIGATVGVVVDPAGVLVLDAPRSTPAYAPGMRIPVACTLDNGAARAQVDEWRRVLAGGSVARESPEALVLALDRDRSRLVEVVELAQREKACCGFFDFTLLIEADRLALRVAVTPDAVAVLDDFESLARSATVDR